MTPDKERLMQELRLDPAVIAIKKGTIHSEVVNFLDTFNIHSPHPMEESTYIINADLRTIYNKWALQNGYLQLSGKALGINLRKHGLYAKPKKIMYITKKRILINASNLLHTFNG